MKMTNILIEKKEEREQAVRCQKVLCSINLIILHLRLGKSKIRACMCKQAIQKASR